MKRITSKDIAKAAGVSRATVSYVLNNKDVKISDYTRQKVLDVAKELNYTPNFFGKGLKTNESMTIGLIIPSFSDISMPVLTKGIELVASELDYGIVVCETDVHRKEKYKVLDFLTKRSVDGIIWAYPDIPANDIKKYIMEKRVPIVCIGPDFKDNTISSIYIDQVSIGEMAAKYLIKYNHKKIILLSTDFTINRKTRLEAIKSILSDKGLLDNFKIRTKQIKSSVVETSGIKEYRAGYAMTADMIEEGEEFTALIGMSEMISVGITNALKEKKVKVPDDTSVISLGGQFISSIIEPPITIMSKPNQEIGKAACNLLFDIMRGNNNKNTKKIIFQPELIEGRSVTYAKT